MTKTICLDGQQVEINLRTVFDDEGTPMSWGAIPPECVKTLDLKSLRERVVGALLKEGDGFTCHIREIIDDVCDSTGREERTKTEEFCLNTPNGTVILTLEREKKEGEIIFVCMEPEELPLI